MTATETWLILGASSALGRALAREAAAGRSAKLLLAGRDTTDLDITASDLRVRFGVSAEVLDFDAAATETHAALATRVSDLAEGSLTVCYVSGSMASQEAAEADPAHAVEMAAVNFTGAMSVLLHMATVLEDRREGRVVVTGSVAGDRGRRRNYAYGATKAGLHAFAEGLAARLRTSGVSVTLVKPGPLDTAMTWGLPEAQLAFPVERAAPAIVRAAVHGRWMVYVPWFWRPIMTVIGLIPAALFRRMKF
jgi:short-subunit dehydrogenase